MDFVSPPGNDQFTILGKFRMQEVSSVEMDLEWMNCDAYKGTHAPVFPNIYSVAEYV